MRAHLSPTQLSRLQQEYENSIHIPDITFTSALSRIRRDLLYGSLTERLYAPGELIFREGDTGDAIYVIRNGAVAVLKGDLKDPALLGFRGPGEIFGEMALLEHKPRSASVASVRPTRLLVIFREDFESMLAETPLADLGLARTISARLREADAARLHDRGMAKSLTDQVDNLTLEKERLLRLQQMREELANFIVHDLRIPLGNLTNALSLMRMVLPAAVWDENREVLEIAQANAEMMTRLSESLLEVSRLEAGSITIHHVHTDLNSLVRGALDQVAAITKERFHIQTTLPDNLPPLRVDPELVQRVLVNLLDNAIKHSQPGDTITIAAEPAGRRVQIAINDMGPGIPVDQRERIFLRFAKVESGGHLRQGFGLGLVFCRLVVEAHNGKIWVEDGNDGKGCKFIFTLPLTKKP